MASFSLKLSQLEDDHLDAINTVVSSGSYHSFQDFIDSDLSSTLARLCDAKDIEDVYRLQWAIEILKKISGFKWEVKDAVETVEKRMEAKLKK